MSSSSSFDLRPLPLGQQQGQRHETRVRTDAHGAVSCLLGLCCAALHLAGGSRVPAGMEDHADWRSLPEVEQEEAAQHSLQRISSPPLTALPLLVLPLALLLSYRLLRRVRVPHSARPSMRRRRRGTGSASSRRPSSAAGTDRRARAQSASAARLSLLWPLRAVPTAVCPARSSGGAGRQPRCGCGRSLRTEEGRDGAAERCGGDESRGRGRGSASTVRLLPCRQRLACAHRRAAAALGGGARVESSAGRVPGLGEAADGGRLQGAEPAHAEHEGHQERASEQCRRQALNAAALYQPRHT